MRTSTAFKTLSIICLTGILFASNANADLVGINFGNGRGTSPGPFPADHFPTGTAFGIAAGDWNNFGDDDGAAVASSVDGNSVNIAWTSNNTWTIDAPPSAAPPITPENQVHLGYLDDGGAGTQPIITLSGFDAVDNLIDYTVTVLLSTDGNDDFEQVTVDGIQHPRVTAIPYANRTGGNGSIGQDLFAGLSADSIDIFTTDGAGRGSIAGLIIDLNIAPAVPEPSTIALAALGLLSLGFVGWRRRRR